MEDLAHGVHDLDSDTLKIYLSNTAPDAAADAVKADLAEISAGNGYSAGGNTLTVSSSEQTGGTYKLVVADTTYTASGGTMATFRYAILFNDTPSSPADPLIGWWDYGTTVSLAVGESFTVDASASNGIIQLV